MSYFKRNLLLIFLGFIISISTFSQPIDEYLKKIPQAQLRQDFLVMKDTLQKMQGCILISQRLKQTTYLTAAIQPYRIA
jgi:hypothetical protein